MSKKHHTPEQIISKMREAEVLLSQGQSVPASPVVHGSKTLVASGTTIGGRSQEGAMGSNQSNVGGSGEKAEQIKEAERKAKYYFDWINCARCWSERGESVEAVRCMKEAEKKAEWGFYWIRCAEAWNEFDKLSEAVRCLKEAEGKARDPFEWMLCAKVWDNLGNRTESGRCKKVAEGVA